MAVTSRSPSMKAFLLIYVLIQHSRHAYGQCPDSPLSKEMIDIWDELSALSSEIDDEIHMMSQPDSQFSVTLRGGNLWNGNVYIYQDGRNKAVCHWNWGKAEADVVCRSLGLGKSVVVSRTTIDEEVYPVKFECEGWERMLGECRATNKTGRPCENGVRVSCDSTQSGTRETRDRCHCDCQMVGSPGSPGYPGEPGWAGPVGDIGLPGWKGEPGKRIIAPISRSPYDDEEFVEQVKLRWKGYQGPWGRPGRKGKAGEQTDCQCSVHEAMCGDWCGPRKGEKGQPGFPGIPGLPGRPGQKGEPWHAEEF